MITNPPILVMIGHGTTGDDGIHPGNHLRWTFDRRMGFPLGGFKLYRRESLKSEVRRYCVSFSSSAGKKFSQPFLLPTIPLSNLVTFHSSKWPIRVINHAIPDGTTAELLSFQGELVITLPEAAWQAELHIIRKTRGKASVKALYDGDVMDQVIIPKGLNKLHTINLSALLLDKLVISIKECELLDICYSTMEDVGGADWDLISGKDPISLPYSHTNYPLKHAYAGQRNGDWREARSRVSRGEYSGKSFREMKHIMRYMLKNNPKGSLLRSSHSYSGENGEKDQAGITVVPSDLLQSASIDPIIARVLGLYIVDEKAKEGVFYDYKIAGDWTSDNPWLLDQKVITFDELSKEKVFFNYFAHGDLGVVFKGSLIKVRDSKSKLAGTTKALRAISFALPEIGIYFPYLVSEVQIFVRNSGSHRPTLTAYRNNAVVGLVNGTEREQILSISANEIDRVVLEGSHCYLCKVCYDQQQLFRDEHYFFIKNIVRGSAKLPDPPTGLFATSFAGTMRKEKDGSSFDARLCVGLRWNIPDGNTASVIDRNVVRYLIKRENQDGSEVALNKANPISVSPKLVNDTFTSPEGWPDETQYFVDNVDFPGNYNYKIAGIDIFGRQTEYGDSVSINVSETLYPAPPVPANIEARYLDPDDPWLSVADKQRLMDNGNEPCLAVSWQWPDTFDDQSPGVSDFHIHLQTGWLNQIRAEVTEVIDNGDGTATVTVITDEIADIPVNSLNNCRLQTKQRFYEITGNTEGLDNGDGLSSILKVIFNSASHDFPQSGPCMLAIEKDSDLFADYRNATAWSHYKLHSGTRDALFVERIVEEDGAVGISHFMTTISDPPYIPSASDPKLYYQISVSSDDDIHESNTSTPASIVAVHRKPPPLPARPELSSTFASFPDVHGKSSATITWTADAHAYSVSRSVDTRLFQIDRQQRTKEAPNERSKNPADYAGYLVLFDEDIHSNIIDSIIVPDEVNYKELNNELLQALADLPGNESAFNSVTESSLKTSEHRDVEDGSKVTFADDSINGRGANRYFYRLQAVDAVLNRSELGSSSLPLYTPNTKPPSVPKVVSVLGGERCIHLSWESDHRSGVSEYLIYRSDSEQNASDFRLMMLIDTVAAVEQPMNWSDEEVIPTQPYFYRISAKRIINGTIVVSIPTQSQRAQAYDLEPSPPVIDEENSGWIYVDDNGDIIEWDADLSSAVNPKVAVKLAWESSGKDHTYTVLRRSTSFPKREMLLAWQDPDSTTTEKYILDDGIDDHDSYIEYSIQSKNLSGLISSKKARIEIAQSRDTNDL